ncbi:MAG: LacI family DNA-binding transcriptional regulator [Cellvibrionaceae bacterium]
MPKATIDDVAKHAGVSIKTVSRVVNGEPNVREMTRRRVQEAIDELHYRPNSSARSLAANKSFLIGLLYDNPVPSYIMDVQNGILGSCREKGYNLLIHPCDFSKNTIADDILQLVKQSRVDGLILTPPLSDNIDVIETLKENSILFVSIAPVHHEMDRLCVYCDDRNAAYKITEYLIQQGHSKIGFIIGHPGHGASQERQQGFEQAMKDHNVPVNNQWVMQGYFDFESGRDCAAKLFKASDRPTAIFASNDEMAAGVMVAAQEAGLTLPNDLSIAGFDDNPIAEHIWPALSTVRQPVKQMASEAAQLLLAHLRGDKNLAQEQELHCELVLRGSIAGPLLP